MELPQETLYHIYQSDNNSIHMFNKKDFVYLHAFDNVFKMLDVNTCKLVSDRIVYTYEH